MKTTENVIFCIKTEVNKALTDFCNQTGYKKSYIVNVAIMEELKRRGYGIK
jgi:predicted transcriptional regulator